MNIQQLEYIVAVDNHRHFAKAAEVCCIAQPTLSAMIQKLEDELGVKIFDRSKYPIEPTLIGRQVIEQARTSLRNLKHIYEMVDNEKEVVKGIFKLGVIPTIAPFLIPELLNHWNETHQHYQHIKLILKESTTKTMIEEIANGTLDGGVLAGPLNHAKLVEYPLYYEQFYAYVSKEEQYKEKEVDLNSIDIDNLWLLENVHCFRGQIERLCHLKKSASKNRNVFYEAGSIDTLINIVDYNQGMTIIPEMSAMGLSEEKQENLRTFKDLTAVREVSLVVSKEYVRKTMLNIIMNLITDSVPKSMLDTGLKKFVVEL